MLVDSPRRSSQAAFFLLLAALISAASPAVILAHDFGGPTGPPPSPPPPPPCPGCCGGGGGSDPCGDPGGGCASSGSPVNFWDGSERHTSLDAQLPGYITILLSRIYDSSADYDSPMGYGWAHAYDYRVYRYPDGT